MGDDRQLRGESSAVERGRGALLLTFPRRRFTRWRLLAANFLLTFPRKRFACEASRQGPRTAFPRKRLPTETVLYGVVATLRRCHAASELGGVLANGEPNEEAGSVIVALRPGATALPGRE